MNKQKKEAYREQLEAMAQRLKSKINGLQGDALKDTGGESSGNLSSAPLHLADLASDNFQQQVAVNLLQNEQQLLGSIATALERIDAGSYGRCEGCNKPIPEGRLQAVPYAVRCVQCAQRTTSDEEVENDSTRA